MDEKNGVEVPEEQVTPEEENLQNEDTPSEDAVADSALSDKPAAEPDSSPDEADAASNQEDMAEDTPNDDGAEPENSDLLSQEEIENALQMEGQDEGGEGDQDKLDVDNFDPTEQASVKQADFQQLSSSHKGGQPRNIDLLMDVELPVSIELGRTKMDISDILSLGPGSIVELEKLVGEPVDLLVNSKRVARGEVVVVDENFGLRITQLISPEERIKNLQ